MATTVRLVVQVDEECRDALKLEAFLRDVDMGEVVNELIRAGLPNAVEQIRERRNPPDQGEGRKSRKS